MERAAMFDYTQFEHVFNRVAPFPDRAYHQETEAFRKACDGVLFIDRVLKALGITKAKIYPPKTEHALRNLHHQLCEANMSNLHRLSIFYYLLLDFDAAHRNTDLSETFLSVSCVPQKYQIFMKGLWYLDRHQFERAIEYVAHPSLIPDFADEIVIVLVRNASHGDFSLPLAYFNAVQPTLKSSQAIELLFSALAATSVTQALQYSRSYPEQSRVMLFNRLIASVLEVSSGDYAADRAMELVGLPFDSDEEQWFEEYLTAGEGVMRNHAKDTLLVRRIITGRFADAVEERGVTARWGPVIEGIRHGLGNRI